MSDITVSFIVPVYGVEQYIEACLESIACQSLPNIEVIVINDGTQDNSMQIVDRFVGKISRMRILQQKNQGISSARNAGLNAASGEYVCFLDSDDFYLGDFAAEFYRQCKEYDLDILRGWYSIYDEQTGAYQPHSFPTVDYVGKRLTGRAFLEQSVQQKANEVVPWLGFFKRDYLLRNTITFPDNISYEEDHVFFLKAMLQDETCNIMQVETEFYAYRKRWNSTTKRPSLQQARDVLKVVEQENELVAKIPFLPRTTQKAAKRYICSSFYQLTSIYGRVPPQDRKVIAEMVPLGIQWQCICNAYDRHQQMKIILFAFARWFVDWVYQRKRLR